MSWLDIVGIVFTCVTANHLGLIAAIEEVVDRNLPIVNCVKCFTFWSVLTYLWWYHAVNIVEMLAISFMASYIALWLELAEGYIDTQYLKLYEKIFRTPADTVTADPDDGHPAGPVS